MLIVNPFLFYGVLFSQENCFLLSPYLMFITESISLDTSDKTTSGKILICSTLWEEIDDISSFIALTTTSACVISDEMFFDNGINITFKWDIFFLKTHFFVLFPQTFFFANLISVRSWIFWQLSSCFGVSSCILFFNFLQWMLVTVYKVKFTLWKLW